MLTFWQPMKSFNHINAEESIYKEKIKQKIISLLIKPDMECNNKFIFSAAIRGFHFYRKTWQPEEGEKLHCGYEKDNPFDDFAIKTTNKNGKTVGHFPMEILQITKFVIARGAMVEAHLSSTRYRRSPLIQGGLEIPCNVVVTMPETVVNQLILEKYEKLVAEKYAEPKNEVIIGSFLVSTISTIPEVSVSKKSAKSSEISIKKKKIEKKRDVPSHDIRNLLSVPRPTVTSTDVAKKMKVVEIDLTD